MLTTKEFAEASGVPCGTLRRWRSVYRGTDEGRQGVLVPVVVGSKGKPSLYSESQLDRARRLHNPNYGQKSLFEEMNIMTTNEAVNALEVDAKAAADEVFGNGENAIPVDADNTHAAQDGAHATIDSNDVEPVTQKEFYAWCTLVDKIRDGQLNCVNRLSRELQAAGIVTDRNQLIELAKTCRHNYNEFRVWLSQFNLDFTDDKTGELQRLVVHEDGNAYFEGVVDSVHVTLTVDEEFQSLIPPLSDDERRQLEENILQDGIRDPLVVWQGHGIIVDGHNRYSIATKHGLPFKTREIAFTDRDAVKLWIVQNQFGRRNLSAYDRSILALKLKPVIAAKAKERMEAGINQYTSPPQIFAEPTSEVLPTFTAQGQKKIENDRETNAQVAQAAGVSRETIRKVEKIEAQASPEIKAALRTGDMSINQAFNEVKRVEKENQIADAKVEIAAQTVDEPEKPTLFVGDGIGFVPDEPYKLLLTDPPYSTDIDDVAAFAESWLPNALRHVRRDGFAYVFIGAYPDELKAYLNVATPENISLCQVLVWTYRNTLGNNPRDRYKLNWQACLFYRGVDAPDLNCPLTSEQWAVQDINAPDGRLGNRYHTWQKPDEIAERFIRHSTQAGDTVFDPFACTGTFLVAAAKLGRKAYGFEIDADNAALTVTKAGLAGIVAALKKNVARVKIDSARKTIATDGISVCNPPKEA